MTKSQAINRDIIQRLQSEVLSLERLNKPVNQVLNMDLGPIEQAFPTQRFPRGVIHEFISPFQENEAATNAFISVIAGKLMEQRGICIWVTYKKTVFPPALKVFGIEPDRIVFVNTDRHRDTLWTIEEALKCSSLAAVVGEIKELSFTESRRLQLAVEQSNVTGFIHRHQPRSENTVACVTRWKIEPVSSITADMPGVGYPRWDVHLLKIRNGRPGSWRIEWSAGGFQYIPNKTVSLSHIHKLKAS